MKKTLYLLLPLLLFVSLRCFAFDSDYDYDYDDDHVSTSEAFRNLLYCGGIMLVGFLIGNIRPIKGLGMLILAIGGFFGFCCLAVIVMNIVAQVVSFGIKVALIVGAIAAAIWIIRGIYAAITGNTK